jgi:hypothetical protein
MDDIFVYCVSLPEGVYECVTPCLEGFTIYINKNLTQERKEEAFQHAIYHIKHKDFEKNDVNEIERNAHHI